MSAAARVKRAIRKFLGNLSQERADENRPLADQLVEVDGEERQVLRNGCKPRRALP
jgi:hypothetical protein